MPSLARDQVQLQINAELAFEPSGYLSPSAERYVTAAMPDGWEWLPLIRLSGPPQIVITRPSR